MVEPGGGDERIADLQREWQESPTPRVGLQLAEEHRRLGRHDEARAVLERSLEAHPGHLSSLVALGKTLLDLGEADAAAASFQRVVERDPTHLVAGKLLIEAHLRRGDGAAAAERLDLYRLLNEGDPEIAELESRWRALDEPPAAPQAPPAAGLTAEATATESGPSAGRDGTPVRPVRPETGAHDPFGPLAGAGDERRWLAGLGGDGIFPVALPPEPIAEPEPDAEPEPEPETVGGSVAGEEEAEVEEPPAAAAAAMHELQAVPGWEAVSVPEAPELEAAAEAAPVPEPTPVPPAAGAAPPVPSGQERATNTLGELYLAQGHLADAERVFRAVLARRPEDAAARTGLAEVERRRAAPLSAGELLDWAEGRGERMPAGGDRRERSAVLLRTYLARLRRRSPADVP